MVGSGNSSSPSLFRRHETLLGTTDSTDLPLLAPIQGALRGPTDVFAATLNLVAGSTSSADLPVRRAIQPAFAGAEDGFLARLCETDVLGQRPLEELMPVVIEQLERIESQLEACDCAALHDALASLQASAAAAADEHASMADALDSLTSDVADLATRLDGLEFEQREALHREIEKALFQRDCMPWLWLPESHGGRLGTAIALLEVRLEAAIASGAPGVNGRVARARLDDATDAAATDPQRACRLLADTLHAMTTP